MLLNHHNAKRYITVVAMLSIALVGLLKNIAPAATPVSREIDALLDGPQVRNNSWSVLIQDCSGPQTLYSRNATKPMKPASNVKLFTTACAYDRLGWDHRWDGQRMKEAIRPINKKSINSRADNLLRHIGSELSGNHSMWAGAGDVVEWARSIGIDMTGAVLKDGSGLSHSNRLSAKQMVSLLRYMITAHRSWDESLAVGAVDGTIQKRFHGTQGAGTVHAKTGTLSGVICLSGIMETRDGDWLLFSFLANNVQNPWATRRAIDRCVVLFADGDSKHSVSLPESSKPRTAKSSKSVIVDNTDKGFSPGKLWRLVEVGNNSFHVRCVEGKSDAASWSATLPSSGKYRVMARWPSLNNSTPQAPFIITTKNGERTVYANQRHHGNEWVTLGEFDMAGGHKRRVKLSCWTSSGKHVVADAIRFDRL